MKSIIFVTIISAFLLASCTTKPRQLPPVGAGFEPANARQYEDGLERNPEMHPWELTRPARKELLQINWAMMQAVDGGKLKVRMIAPPLQLSGDPNVDLPRTYNILLVADDIKTNETFLDIYEVHVGPPAQLVTVRPAEAATNLAAADSIYAEAQLTRLRLDKQTLKSNEAFATNYAGTVSNYLSEAGTDTTNLLDKLTLKTNEMATNINLVVTNIKDLTNQIAALSTSTSATNDLIIKLDKDLKAAKTADDTSKATQELKQAKDNLAKELGDLEAKKGQLTAKKGELDRRTLESKEVNVQITETQTRFKSAQDMVHEYLRGPQLLGSAIKALEVLENFWGAELQGNQQLSDFSKAVHAYRMNSAAMVTFRGQALDGLAQITIEVTRKVQNSAMISKIKEARKERPLQKALVKVKNGVDGLNGLLLAEDRNLDNSSRSRYAKVQLDQLQDAVGELEAQIVLRRMGLFFSVSNQPETAGLASGSSVGNPSQTFMSLGRQTRSDATSQDQLADALSTIGRLEEQQQGLLKSIGQLGAGQSATGEDLADAQRLNHALWAQLAEALKNQSNTVNELAWSLASVTNIPPALTNSADLQKRLQLQFTQTLLAVNKTETALGKAQTNTMDLMAQARELGANQTNSIERGKLVEKQLAALSDLANKADKLRDSLLKISRQIDSTLAEKQQGQPLSPEISSTVATTNLVADALAGALTNITNRLACLKKSLVNANLAWKSSRMKISYELTGLRDQLSKAIMLAPFRGIKSEFTDGGAPVDGETPVVTGSDDDNELVQKIIRGDLAIFRLNVLHGIVSTTAFLLADDEAAQLFGHSFADEFYAAQVAFHNVEKNPILIYGNTMRLIVRMNAATDSLSDDGQFRRMLWWATFEPIDYDSIRRIVESIQEDSWQKWASKVLDMAQMAGGAWAAFGPSKDALKGIALFGAFTPKLKDLLEADLKRNALNFHDRGLNTIEEIPAQGTLTRYVFLPKGPIYGTYAHDKAIANSLPMSSTEGRWNPFRNSSRDFGKMALQPAFIHDIRREEVYVEGKRILASDPLTSNITK